MMIHTTAMKGDIIFKVLESVEKVALGFADLFEVFLEAGYGASLGNLEYRLRKKENKGTDEEEKQRIAQRYYSMLSRLKKEGFLEEPTIKNGRSFFLTSAGKKKLSFLKRKRKELPRMPKVQDGPTFVIVAFDIPEREKRKRDWLRQSLRHMGLSMVQKSVWIGKVRLPEDFMESLRRLRLLDCVEIFEITRTGTLKHLV